MSLSLRTQALESDMSELKKDVTKIKYIAWYLAGMISIKAGSDILPMVSALLN